MKDEQVWITSDQGPNCIVMSTLTGTQTKNTIHQKDSLLDKTT